MEYISMAEDLCLAFFCLGWVREKTNILQKKKKKGILNKI